MLEAAQGQSLQQISDARRSSLADDDVLGAVCTGFASPPSGRQWAQQLHQMSQGGRNLHQGDEGGPASQSRTHLAGRE